MAAGMALNRSSLLLENALSNVATIPTMKKILGNHRNLGVLARYIV
jgi:hypothetical protein